MPDKGCIPRCVSCRWWLLPKRMHRWGLCDVPSSRQRLLMRQPNPQISLRTHSAYGCVLHEEEVASDG